MAKTMSFFSMYFFFALLVLIHVTEKSQGLSIELIHPFSTESPFYKSNITLYEMIKKFSKRPRTYTQATSLNHTWSGAKVIRPMLEQFESHLVKLNLGTFDDENQIHKTHYFDFDIGGALTWLQCEDCTKSGNECFPQHYAPYPNSKSATFRPLIYGKNHQLCFSDEHIGHYCSYQDHYIDGSYSIGILAYEVFSFDSTENVWTVVMGCGIRNKLTHLGMESIQSGVLGMGWGPHSFVNQIMGISHGRFSYCLPPIIEHGRHSTFLRFGSDTPSINGLQSLPIHQYEGRTPYYVTLHGISINSQRLNIPPQYLAKTNRGGGCVLDTGSPYTYLPKAVHRILKKEMIAYLTRAEPDLKLRTTRTLFSLCFERYNQFNDYENLPTVTFHFENDADLVLQPNIVFLVRRIVSQNKEVIYMLIEPSYANGVAVIGSQSMANHMFVFDLPTKLVYFGARDCAQNP